MKKLVSLFLTVCFVFLAANNIWPTNSYHEKKNTTINLCSVSDFSSKLESENVDTKGFKNEIFGEALFKVYMNKELFVLAKKKCKVLLNYQSF